MNEAELHELAGELFDRAMELPEDERDAFLDSACGDPTLRKEVERWIEHDLGGTGPLDRPPRFIDAPTPMGQKLGPGARLGPYRLERMLGRGGMGTVYLAGRDDEEFERRVAIKFVTEGGPAARNPWRFYRERQILADLEHPSIARLYDGGRTEDGQPYLVLEYVDGEPIDAYCDRSCAGLVDRIRLLIEVCGAVDYAHRNLVVHRDLKPGNILVDATGRPKLLDFGIAKLLGAEASLDGRRTTVENQSPLTLSHASPEQVLGESITTASDVYCLGVVLYELLTGLHPFGDSSDSTPYGLMQRITKSEPARPSQAVAKLAANEADSAAAHGKARSTTPRSLARVLEGDLDTILLKALRREPENRYPSAYELAEDLTRYLANRPISAGSPGALDRLKKFGRRHRAAVMVAGSAAWVLIALAITFVLALLAQVERTEKEKIKAERLVEFLTGTFAVSDPEASIGETVTARALLDEGARRIASELRDEPDIQASVLDAMGQIYHQIGLFEPARRLVAQGLETRRRLPDAADLVESLSHLAAIEANTGRLDQADEFLQEALERGATLKGNEATAHAGALEVQALVRRLQYRYDEAGAAYRAALDVRRTLGDQQAPELAKTLLDYGFLLQEQGRLDGAAIAYSESLELHRRLFGPTHPAVADSLKNLGDLARFRNDFEGSESLYREALESRRTVYGERHLEVAELKNALGLLIGEAGRHEEAVDILREAVETCEALTGKSTEYATMASNLAVSLTQIAELDEAETLFREALTIRAEALGAGHPLVGQTHLTLGRLLRRRGRLDEAQNAYEKAAEAARGLPEGHRAISYPSLALADLLLERGRGEDAEQILHWALEELARSHPPGHWRFAMANADLGRARHLQGDVEGARRRFRGALEKLEGDENRKRAEQVQSWLDALSEQSP